MGQARYLVMDTCAWLFHYGLGPAATVAAVRAVAYTSITLKEVRSSPRPEIAGQRNAIIQYIHRSGVRVGAGYWDLIREAGIAGVPRANREDAAIVLAAEGPDRAWLGCDSWAAVFALGRGAKVIYIDPNL